MRILDAYVAVLGALAAGGIVLVIAGLRGTTTPAGHRPGPPSRLRRWWRGSGRTRGERTARQALLVGGAVVGVLGYAISGVPAIGLLTARRCPVSVAVGVSGRSGPSPGPRRWGTGPGG